MEKNVNVIPFHHRQLSRTGHADRDRCQRESELPLRENTADTRTRENYFKYITKFKSPLNHNARDSEVYGINEGWRKKRGGGGKERKKKEKLVRVR